MEPYHQHGNVEAGNRMGLGRVDLLHNTWQTPIDIAGVSDAHHLQLCMMPVTGTARACFVDHWHPRRFEPLGQLFLIPAREQIHFKSECRRQNSVVCAFEPQAVERWFDRDLQWTDGRLRGALDIASSRIRNLLFLMGEEVRTPGFASDTMVELMASQVLIELSRYLSGIEADKVTGGLSAWRLRLIEQRLVEESQPPSLTELAQLCSLSVRQLTRAFRVSRGRSIGSYIAGHRVDHAKRLLASGMSVKAVAFETGFSASSNFTTAFVRETGETPRQYRLRVNATGKASRSGRRRPH